MNNQQKDKEFKHAKWLVYKPSMMGKISHQIMDMINYVGMNGKITVSCPEIEELNHKNNQLKKRVEELEKLNEKKEVMLRKCGHPSTYGFGTHCKICENQKLKTQVAEMREALEKWLEWEKGQVKKYGRYCQKEINDLIDAGNKVLQKHKESE